RRPCRKHPRAPRVHPGVEPARRHDGVAHARLADAAGQGCAARRAIGRTGEPSCPPAWHRARRPCSCRRSLDDALGRRQRRTNVVRTTTWLWRALLGLNGRRHHATLSLAGPVILVSIVTLWVLVGSLGDGRYDLLLR